MDKRIYKDKIIYKGKRIYMIDQSFKYLAPRQDSDIFHNIQHNNTQHNSTMCSAACNSLAD